MAAALAVAPLPAPVGSVVTVTGTGFRNAKTRLTLDGVGATSNIFRPAKDGTFRVGITVSATPKSQTLQAEQYIGGKWSVVAKLAPLLTFAPPSGVDTTPPVIIGTPNASNITSATVILSWVTNELSSTKANYGTTGAYGTDTALVTSPVTTHNILLTGLAASTLYHFRVRSIDGAGNEVVSGDYTFTTVASGTDVTAPVISNIVASGITTTSAVISWSLDEYATGQIEFGLTPSYGRLSARENSFTYNAHVQTISSLVSGSTYHYRIISTDASGNTATSDDQTFITQAVIPPPPPGGGGSMYVPNIYGVGIICEGRNNHQVRPAESTPLAYRFIASQTSVPLSIAVNQKGGTTYSGGSGGTIKCVIQRSNASGEPDGVDIATVTWVPTNPAGSWENKRAYNFTSATTLTAGQRYHLVFTNLDLAPNSNWISLNVSYDQNPYTPRQIAFTDDFAVMHKYNGGAWTVVSYDTPVFDLTYANGQHDGQAYFGILTGSIAEISGTTKMARERFTVSGGTRNVNQGGMVVWRVSGSSDLTLRLEDSAGSVIVTGTVASSTFPEVGVPGDPVDGGTWGVINFATTTLTNGSTYRWRASCAAGTTYYTYPVQEQDPNDAWPDWGSRRFLDGVAEETLDSGSTWAPPYLYAAIDLMFYLALV